MFATSTFPQSMLAKSALVLPVLFAAFAADTVPPASDLTVHEWGTFTSVASEAGWPVSWTPLKPPSDLPCFVYRLSAICVKCNSTAPVRMETPVLYFYSRRATTVSVHVGLPSGMITEWYPKATGLPILSTSETGGKIDWNTVEVLPGVTPAYPVDDSPSHYYAARNTDSASLRVDDQEEKLLFYRGVAGEGVVLEPKQLAGGKLELDNIGTQPIPFAAVFENRAGRIGYRLVRGLSAPVTVDFPELTGDAAALRRDLASALTAAGLYPKEAAAMIDTWGDSWFEEGMRVFYILPRALVNAVLPLQVTPAPATTERVFVGRVEVLSPAIRDSLRAALAAGDTATMAQYGRFLGTFVELMKVKERVEISPAARAFMDAARARIAQTQASPCKEPVIPTGQQR